ncbi:hypothetical protein EAF04_006040 [Stromatinia cepivora]|nr:hypothetical protein EAF04_006040 [Stromatinia cepivora]
MSHSRLFKHCHIRVQTQQNRAFQTSRSLRPSHNQRCNTSHPSTPRTPTLLDPIDNDQTACRLRDNQPRTTPARTIVVPSAPRASETITRVGISLEVFFQGAWVDMCRKSDEAEIANMCDSLYRAELKLLATPWKINNLLAHVMENDDKFHCSKEDKEEEVEKWLDGVEEVDLARRN